MRLFSKCYQYIDRIFYRELINVSYSKLCQVVFKTLTTSNPRYFFRQHVPVISQFQMKSKSKKKAAPLESTSECSFFRISTTELKVQTTLNGSRRVNGACARIAYIISASATREQRARSARNEREGEKRDTCLFCSFLYNTKASVVQTTCSRTSFEPVVNP